MATPAERDINLRIALEFEKFPCLYNYKLSDYARRDKVDMAWNEIARRTNLSVWEAKEKWKHIRSGFVRSLKPISNGSSTRLRKPYYLQDYMKFIVPYVKLTNRSSRKAASQNNLAESQIGYYQEQENDTNNDEETPFPSLSEPILIDDFSQDHQQTVYIPSSTLVHQEANNVFPTTSETPNGFPTTAETPNTAPTGIKRKGDGDDLDRLFLDYLQNKKKRETNNFGDTANKYFLLSLLPELKTLNEAQMRQFKIKVLLLIENLKKSVPGSVNKPTPTESLYSFIGATPPTSARSSEYQTTPSTGMSQQSFQDASRISSTNNLTITNVMSVPSSSSGDSNSSIIQIDMNDSTEHYQIELDQQFDSEAPDNDTYSF